MLTEKFAIHRARSRAFTHAMHSLMGKETVLTPMSRRNDLLEARSEAKSKGEFAGEIL